MTGHALIGCAAVVAALAAPTPAAADVPRKLLVYGDSFAIGAEPYMPDALPDWRIAHDVDYSRKAQSAARALSDRGERLAPIVHLSLGTVNDPERPRRFRRAVRRAMRAVGRDRCVVWANIARPKLRRDGSGYNGWRPLNRVLTDEAARRDNLVIADWAALFRAHPGWASPVDATHVNERGYRARARLVARGVAECYARLTRRGTS